MSATPALATPVQWSLSGTVTGALPGVGGAILGPLYPAGTPFSLLLSFDTIAPNWALNPATQGFFQFPGAGGQLTLGSTTFISSLIAFEINCPGASCQTVPGPVQLFDPLAAVTRVLLVGGPPIAITLNQGFGGFFTGVCVVCFDGLTFTVASSTITAVPEPVSMVMVGTGLLTMAVALRKRRHVHR